MTIKNLFLERKALPKEKNNGGHTAHTLYTIKLNEKAYNKQEV